MRYLLVAFCCGLMIGCSPDNIVEVDVDVDTHLEVPHHPLVAQGIAHTSVVAINCVEIAYPFMIKVDGRIALINNAEEYSEAQNDYATGIDFEYPIETTDQEVITSPIALVDKYADCLPSKGWISGEVPYFDIDNTTSCLEMVLPVTLGSDSGAKTFDKHEDVLVALTEGQHYFSFPLRLRNGEAQEGLIQDSDQLFAALNACHTFTYPDLDNVDRYKPSGCYDIVYPQGFVDGSGVEHSIENKDQYCTGSIKGDIVAWTYPISFTDYQSRTVTVQSADTWPKVKAACQDYIAGDFVYQLLRRSIDYDPSEGCHTLIYPLSLTTARAKTKRLYNAADVRSLVDDWHTEDTYVDYNYPLDIVRDADEVILLDYNDLVHYMITCQ